MKDKREELIVDRTIIESLMMLGLPQHHRGFKYVHEIIKKLLFNDSDTFLIGNCYKNLAMEYNTKEECIERDIRYTIDIGYTRTKQSVVEMEFKNTIGYDKAKPSNKQFIETMLKKVEYELELQLD